MQLHNNGSTSLVEEAGEETEHFRAENYQFTGTFGHFLIVFTDD